MRSALDIQAEYLAFLERIFGRPREEMERCRASPSEVAAQLAAKPGFTDALRTDIVEFRAWSRAFWLQNAAPLRRAVAEASGSRACYVGGAIDTVRKESFRAALIHLDLLLLTEPFTMLGGRRELERDAPTFSLLFATHALSVLALRGAMLDTQPAVMMVPSHVSVNPGGERQLHRSADKAAALLHAMSLSEKAARTGHDVTAGEAHNGRRMSAQYSALQDMLRRASGSGRLAIAPNNWWSLGERDADLRAITKTALVANAIAHDVGVGLNAVCLIDNGFAWECALQHAAVGASAQSERWPRSDSDARVTLASAGSVDAALRRRGEPLPAAVRARWRETLSSLRPTAGPLKPLSNERQLLVQAADEPGGASCLSLRVDLAFGDGVAWLLLAP